MKETDYAYAVARVRALENNLLTAADLQQLLSVAHVDDCASILAEKGYGDADTNRSFDRIFAEELKKTWQLINEIAPDPSIFDIFLLKNDFHNLKVILKGMSTGKEYESLILKPSHVNTETIKSAVINDDFSLLPLYMAEVAQAAYDALNKENDSRAASIMIDIASQKALYEGAKKTKNTFIISLVRLMIDCINVKTAARCAMIGKDAEFISKTLTDADGINTKELASTAGVDLASLKEYLYSTSFGEGAEFLDSNFSAFEKWCDDLILKQLTNAKYKAFGPEPIIAYLFAKETEIKTVHIITTGKASQLEESAITGRLRMLYV